MRYLSDIIKLNKARLLASRLLRIAEVLNEKDMFKALRRGADLIEVKQFRDVKVITLCGAYIMKISNEGDIIAVYDDWYEKAINAFLEMIYTYSLDETRLREVYEEAKKHKDLGRVCSQLQSILVEADEKISALNTEAEIKAEQNTVLIDELEKRLRRFSENSPHTHPIDTGGMK